MTFVGSGGRVAEPAHPTSWSSYGFVLGQPLTILLDALTVAVPIFSPPENRFVA